MNSASESEAKTTTTETFTKTTRIDNIEGAVEDHNAAANGTGSSIKKKKRRRRVSKESTSRLSSLSVSSKSKKRRAVKADDDEVRIENQLQQQQQQQQQQQSEQQRIESSECASTTSIRPTRKAKLQAEDAILACNQTDSFNAEYDQGYQEETMSFLDAVNPKEQNASENFQQDVVTSRSLPKRWTRADRLVFFANFLKYGKDFNQYYRQLGRSQHSVSVWAYQTIVMSPKSKSLEFKGMYDMKSSDENFPPLWLKFCEYYETKYKIKLPAVDFVDNSLAYDGTTLPNLNVSNVLVPRKKKKLKLEEDGNSELPKVPQETKPLVKKRRTATPQHKRKSRKRVNGQIQECSPDVPQTMISNTHEMFQTYQEEEMLPKEENNGSITGTEHNEYYVEEVAWRYHNPPLPLTVDAKGQESPVEGGVAPEDLKPLPPAPPLPELPQTNSCKWSFDEQTRVLHADFRQPDEKPVVCLPEDIHFLLRMYERDDITVISDGLVTGLDPEKWTLQFIENAVGDEYYHKYRKFQKTTVEVSNKTRGRRQPEIDTKQQQPEDDNFVYVKYLEIDGFLSMRVSDYIRYLRLRGKALAEVTQDHNSSTAEGQRRSEELTADRTFTFLNHEREEITIDVIDVVLYMIDYDMVKLLPMLNSDFVSCFKLPDTLPGGRYCMMNSVNVNGRPFMGPNFYLTPPASFTHFHQDGHGTVDSGHFCLSGYNEVVMLRRMPERHKKHALYLLTGAYAQYESTSMLLGFEPLYNLPHGDGLGEKPEWPRQDGIDKCKAMNYYPSVFILKPGQLVHINKSRLHAFRKLSNHPVPKDDCHANLRTKLAAEDDRIGNEEILCISVAWDWMFRGVTTAGINREVITALECAALNRRNGVDSLAIPEHTLLQMARTLAPGSISACSPPLTGGIYQNSLIGASMLKGRKQDSDSAITPVSGLYSNIDICKGIYPGLKYVVNQHLSAIKRAKTKLSASRQRGKKLSLAKKPNSWENPLHFTLDPYGNSDFFCKLCHKELSNIYLHCDGCEILLCKDFNICIECYTEQRFARMVLMHPLNKKRHSTINHLGDPHFSRTSRCPCKNGPACKHCGFCAGCSCRCHTWFTLHFRFYNEEDELQLLQRVEEICDTKDEKRASEAENRLSKLVAQLPSSDEVSEDQSGGEGTESETQVQEKKNNGNSVKKMKTRRRSRNMTPVKEEEIEDKLCEDGTGPSSQSPEEKKHSDIELGARNTRKKRAVKVDDQAGSVNGKSNAMLDGCREQENKEASASDTVSSSAEAEEKKIIDDDNEKTKGKTEDGSATSLTTGLSASSSLSSCGPPLQRELVANDMMEEKRNHEAENCLSEVVTQLPSSEKKNEDKSDGEGADSPTHGQEKKSIDNVVDNIGHTRKTSSITVEKQEEAEHTIDGKGTGSSTQSQEENKNNDSVSDLFPRNEPGRVAVAANSDDQPLPVSRNDGSRVFDDCHETSFAEEDDGNSNERNIDKTMGGNEDGLVLSTGLSASSALFSCCVSSPETLLITEHVQAEHQLSEENRKPETNENLRESDLDAACQTNNRESDSNAIISNIITNDTVTVEVNDEVEKSEKAATVDETGGEGVFLVKKDHSANDGDNDNSDSNIMMVESNDSARQHETVGIVENGSNEVSHISVGLEDNKTDFIIENAEELCNGGLSNDDSQERSCIDSIDNHIDNTVGFEGDTIDDIIVNKKSDTDLFQDEIHDDMIIDEISSNGLNISTEESSHIPIV